LVIVQIIDIVIVFGEVVISMIIILWFVVIVTGKMIIQALPEISTEGLTLDDVDMLMERTRKVMCDTFESLVTEVNKQ
jgi:hypothetical protein